MKQFKVGDKVRVRKDLVVGEMYGRQSFANCMRPMLGKIVTIRTNTGMCGYTLEESAWFWSDEMLEKIEEKKHTMKFKIGDKVKIVGATGNRAKYNGNIEVISDINPNDENQKAHYGIEGSFWIFYETELEPIKPVRQSIHIYTDGVNTTAILREGKKTVKKALAKCNSGDEFDFKIGASLALDRLLERRPYSEIVAEAERLQSEPDKPMFDWEAFETQKIAVHCDTEEKAKAFLKECHDRRMEWYGGASLLSHNNWELYREKTCYTSGVTYGSKGYFETEDYPIIPYPFTPEPPKYYNGKIVCVDTNGGGYHTVGRIYECKDGLLDNNTGKGGHNYIPYKSFEDLQKRAVPNFIELMED